MEWLYCDFHIHSTWSDGDLTIYEIVKMYGTAGFDVISITDHLLDSQSLAIAKHKGWSHCGLRKEQFSQYLLELHEAANHAWDEWGMLLLPGIELTNDTSNYHILALDIQDHISPDLEVEDMLRQIRAQGAISIACHPHVRSHSSESPSRHLWEHHERFAEMFDAWEVANRDDLFNAVGLEKYRYVANSDFHQLQHFKSWKTMLRCSRNPASVKQAIRSNDAVSIFFYQGGPLKNFQANA
jgi:3',5'-nucleoside bisphosphate phosphatase